MRTFACISATLGLLAATFSAHAGDDVRVIVLKEQGIGTAAQAQSYIDSLMAIAKEKNGWASATGKWVTSRKRAKRYIDKKQPQFGIMSLGAYLDLRSSKGLTVVGQVDSSTTGGRTYHLVAKGGSGVDTCKGAKVASNHADDARFIDRVVAGGAFSLSDFDLVKTRRPVQTLKKVIRGDTKCALIDDAQLAEAKHVDGGSALTTVWSSATLPPMAVVSFSGTSDATRAKFKASLGSLCAGAGKAHCDKVGIKGFSTADDGAYKRVIDAYGR